MRIDLISIFPSIFDSYLNESILKIAQKNGHLDFHIHDLRKFSKNKHHKVDDKPFGGGPGMVMTAQPIVDCIKFVKTQNPQAQVIYLSPKGKILSYSIAKKLSTKKGLILLSGRYEGVDQRAIDLVVDSEISIGKYILTGGELAAMVLVDVVSRFIPGVLGDEHSIQEESFSPAIGKKKEYPHYTKPRVFQGLEVPEVLLSGNHANIELWRKNNLS